MSRSAPYLGIVAALLLGVFVSVSFGGSATVSPLPPDIIIPAFADGHKAFITTDDPSVSPAAASSSPAAAATPPPQALHTTPRSATPHEAAPPERALTEVRPPAATASPEDAAAALDASATTLRAALVNILCSAPSGSGLHSITGSGVIIDPKGLILTNAHIAQYFLLADRGVSCVIRAGNPATNRYQAALAYISPAWIRANTEVLTQSDPNGTGEDDFAVLAISGSATHDPLPSAFPFLPLGVVAPGAGAPVVIASYGAQFLAPGQIASSLFPTVVFGSVKQIYTFKTTTADVLALGGSAAAQEGSSGGAAADAAGTLAGTITTSTTSGTTETRSLNAITASYIRAEYASETGEPLDLLLARDPAQAVADFSPRIPDLAALITAHLP